MDYGETSVEGVVERIVYFNDDTCYCIAVMKPTSRTEKKESITITGVMPAVQCGETVLVKGIWSRHPQYGAQIKVREFESRLPSGVYGIEKYLGSGLVDGIGPVYAKKIVERFGEDTLRIIDTESSRLREVKGIGAARAKKIKASWDEQRALRDIMIAMRIYGIGMAMCVRIMRHFGADAAEVVRTQPYRLMREIDGIGFKTADMIALNIGISNESPERIEAGILHLVGESEDSGNTCILGGELVSRAAEMLGVDSQRCLAALDSLVNSCQLRIVGGKYVQSAQQDYAERRIVQNLARIQKSPSSLPPIKFEKAAEWAKSRAGFDFAPEQTSAIIAALKNKVSIITGGPGTGKTTILRALCDILRAKKCLPVLAAPTGRAAQRMSESTGVEAKTLHRLLGYENGKFVHNEYNCIEAKFLVIDEASMLDTKLAASVFAAAPDSAHIVLVGDIDQLPSVGAGNVLKDVIASEKFAVTTLNKIFRQGERSQIVVVAHGILGGSESMSGFEPCSLGGADPLRDVNFISAENPQDCMDACVELIRDKIPLWYGIDPISDVQLIAPMHKGTAGISAFNSRLKSALNDGAKPLMFGSASYCVGDKIMQTRNNYDIGVFNGDMGRIVSISPDGSYLSADFDGRKIELAKSDLADFQHAYAISIHKSQGSEFPVVVIPLLRQHYIMLQRNLLYTGITRARKKVFVVGDPSAWAAAVRNSRSVRRRTYLKERLNPDGIKNLQS